MNSARSSQALHLNWTSSLQVQQQAAQDQLSWFSKESSAYFAALLAFALGSSCWRDHAVAMTVFGGILASVGYWRSVLAGAMQSHGSTQPTGWSAGESGGGLRLDGAGESGGGLRLDGAAIRRSTFLTGVLWAALGCWAATAQLPLAAHFIYLLLTAAFATSAARGLAPDLRFSLRYQAVLLVPAITTQLIAARFGNFQAGYGLAGVTVLFGAFMAARAGQFNDQYWESLTSHARLEAQSRELEKARQSAESSKEIESGLLTKVSMESQAPLKGLARMTAMLLETPVTADQREYLEIVRDSTNMLRHTMNNLLAFSAWKSGEGASATTEPFEPQRILDGVAAMFQPKAAAKCLELRTNPGPGLEREVLGDTHRIGLALANLVANAIKFTEHGSVEIVADCRTGAEQEELLFEVRDTGIGIPAEKLATLFQRSSREGLGLLIADTIAEQMGGRVSAESTPGEGSRFRLTLRLPYAAGAKQEELATESVLVRA
jgi:signal transduction histidine kinase